MPKKLIKILAINPGTRYIGIAVFEGPELLDWRVKVFKGKWSKEKLKKILASVRLSIERYEPDALVIKRLHRCRSSANLNLLVTRIKQLARRKGLRAYQYSIKEAETFLIRDYRANKRNLAELLASKYPELMHEFNKEKTNKNSYYLRMFEAVGLGAVCFHKLHNN